MNILDTKYKCWLLLAIFYIIFDALTNQQMFQINHSLTLYLQSQLWNNMPIRNIMRWMAVYGYAPIVVICSLIEYAIKTNITELKARTIFILITLYTLSVLKLIYGQIRPYMLYNDIQQDMGYKSGCDMEYGNPSGHSLSFPVALVNLTIDYYIQLQPNKPFIQIFIILFTSIQILLVGFSRVYLGVHSFNQVILGWVYASILIILYFQYIKPQLIKMIRSNYHSKPLIFAVLLFYLASNSIALIINQYKQTQIDSDQYYYSQIRQTIINHGCKINEIKFLNMKCITDAAIINIAVGMVLGIIFNPIKQQSTVSVLSVQCLVRISCLVFSTLPVFYFFKMVKTSTLFSSYMIHYNLMYLIIGTAIFIVPELIFNLNQHKTPNKTH